MRFWALFIVNQEVKWHFNAEDQFFQQRALQFVMTLEQFGEEFYDLYGEGVVTVLLDNNALSQRYNMPDFVKKVPEEDELFILTLQKSIVLLVSNVMTTAQLLEHEKIPEDEDLLVRAILVSQGALLYANLITNVENEEEEKKVDRLFRSIIVQIGREADVDSLVREGRCSLSGLSLTELLLFHSLVRRHFHEIQQEPQERGWALLTHRSGIDVSLDYFVPKDSTLMASFLSIFLSFCVDLFSAPPSCLIFGGTSLDRLKFISGTDHFLVASYPESVLLDPQFAKMLRKASEEHKNDIRENLSLYLMSLIISDVEKSLKSLSTLESFSLFESISNKTAHLNIKTISLTELPNIGSKRAELLKNRDINSVTKLILTTFNHNEESGWILKAQTDAKRLLEDDEGWKLAVELDDLK